MVKDYSATLASKSMADPSPSSPGASPVQLKDCVEELLKFTLISSIKGKLQTGLSNHYCANLLTDADTSNLLLSKTDGLKTVEGRCSVGDYKRMRSGDLLLFNKCLILRVQDIRQYASFHEMLEVESLAEVLPGVSSIQEGVQIYRNFYSEEKERSNGVLAICVKMSTSQPYVIMSSILSGLSYGGIQKLLGFVETTGTNPELLPPPASTLLSTFLAPHNPDVKGSTLTNGARALAKHVNRSSEGYWGTLHGSDTEKNKHATVVIKRLLTHCSWMNMHIVRPHGSVFEIRTDDGYGARWSGDGTKFIGFLEPYMMDGYSCGWKH